MKRILIAIDVADDLCEDMADTLASVTARLEDEAGYLDDGRPVTPSRLVVTEVPFVEHFRDCDLEGVYAVGCGL